MINHTCLMGQDLGFLHASSSRCRFPYLDVLDRLARCMDTVLAIQANLGWMSEMHRKPDSWIRPILELVCLCQGFCC